MATILRKESSLTREKQRVEREEGLLQKLFPLEAGLVLLLLALGLIRLSLVGSANLLIMGALLAILPIGHYFRIQEHREDAGKMTRGLRGEEKVAALFEERLHDDLFILNDVEVRNGRRRGQIDHLIVGPDGIFVVETKNWPGHITGDARQPYWTVTRPGRRPQQMKSPTRQCKRQASILHELLRAHGIAWRDIQPIVVFFSPQSTLDITNLDIPVYSPERAAAFINAYSSDRIYSPDEVQTVLKLFT